jgi:hypothetical protein
MGIGSNTREGRALQSTRQELIVAGSGTNEFITALALQLKYLQAYVIYISSIFCKN